MKSVGKKIVISIILPLIIFFLILLSMNIYFSFQSGHLDCSGVAGTGKLPCESLWKFIFNIIFMYFFLLFLCIIITGGLALIIPAGIIFLILFWWNKRKERLSAGKKENKIRKK